MKKPPKWLIGLLIMMLLYQPTFGETPIVYIDSEEAFLDFSQRCVLDIYSQNLMVVLTRDLDFKDHLFVPVPSFSGIFDGGGYTIKNIMLSDEGSNQGVFRYVEEVGIVKNLKVEGFINPSGTRSNVGGIVGTNHGTLVNLSFSGDVSGLTSIGGVVGLNSVTGVIQFCENKGRITGEHYTGGVVGENKGYISNSTNYGDINTTDDAMPNNNAASYDLNNVDLNNLNSTENIEAQTDTGGIVGYNVGLIYHSINRGDVGYPHVGYNIGGIVGRHSGYVYGCSNFGHIYGRKDVGGIIGQMEPYIRLLFSEDTLSKLDEEMQLLNELIETAVTDAHNNGSDVSYQFDQVNEIMNQASNDLNTLLTDTSDYADKVGTTINEGFERIRKITLQLEYVVDEMKMASDSMSSGFGHLKTGFDHLADASGSLDDGFGEIQNAMYDLELASQDADKALFKIQEGMKDISQAAEPTQKYKDGVKLVKEGMTDLQDASEDFNKAMKIIVDYYNANGNLVGLDLGPVFTELENASKHLEVAIPKLNNGINLLLSELEDDMTLIREAFVWFEGAFTDLRAMSEDLDNMRKDLDEAIQDFEDGAVALEKSMKDISKGMQQFETASDHMTSSFDYMDKILNEQQKKPPLAVPMLSSFTEESGQKFFDTLNKVSSELETLNQKIRYGSDILYDHLVLINEQYKVVMDIVREGIQSLSFDSDAYFEDISDAETKEKIERGLTINCFNEGTIEGDVDVGGIVGAMAIEYDFDPEDDIIKSGNETFNFKYQTKAALIGSVNKGEIIGKKDYVGGVIGRMDMGLVLNGENYSDVKSIDGHYVGGIIGSSAGVVRNSYSMSRLEGKKYVGGIAGFGHHIYDSYAMIQVVSGIEYIGSIAGDIDGEAVGNYFVNNEWAGIDGISYASQSMPLSYSKFTSHDLPEAFKSLKLTYVVDEVKGEIPFEYGDSIEFSMLPELPYKEGYYGRWSDMHLGKLYFSKEIEAVYTPKIKVIASDDADQPKLLIEGAFEPEDKLRMVPMSTYDLKPGEKLIDEWRVAVESDRQDTLVYRYLKPEAPHIKFYENSSGQWMNVDFKEDGSYLTFETQHHNFKLVVVQEVFNYKLWIMAGGLILILITSTWFIKKRRIA